MWRRTLALASSTECGGYIAVPTCCSLLLEFIVRYASHFAASKRSAHIRRKPREQWKGFAATLNQEGVVHQETEHRLPQRRVLSLAMNNGPVKLQSLLPPPLLALTVAPRYRSLNPARLSNTITRLRRIGASTIKLYRRWHRFLRRARLAFYTSENTDVRVADEVDDDHWPGGVRG